MLLYANNATQGANAAQVVEMVIPTIRTALRADFTLITTHEVTKTEQRYESIRATVKPYKVTVAFEFPVNMQPGQYTFKLEDEDGELQRGVMQVGGMGADIKQYTPTIQVKTYERH